MDGNGGETPPSVQSLAPTWPGVWRDLEVWSARDNAYGLGEENMISVSKDMVKVS